MLIPLIWGHGTKSREVKDLGHLWCPICKQVANIKEIEHYNYFSIFYIEVRRWNKQTWFRCTACGNTFKMPQSQRDTPQLR